LGLLITVGTILVLEALHLTGLPLPVPAGVLLLVVAAATYLDGVRRGLVAAVLAVVYEFYAYVQHGTALQDASGPPVRAVVLSFVTFAVVGMVALFRRQLDELLRNERVLLEAAERARERAEADRQELARVLEDVQCAQEAMRMQASLLDAVGEAIIATDENGRITYWNDPAVRLFGRPVDQAATRSIEEVMPDPPHMRPRTVARIARCETWSGELEFQRADGQRLTVLVSDSPIRDEDGRCAGMVRVVTNVSAQKETERVQRLLADAGSALAASLDYESTIRTVARLCVPYFADGCVVDVVESDGVALRLEAAHAEPRVEDVVRGARTRHPLDLASDDPVAGVIRTGLPVIFDTLTEAQLAGFAEDEEHLEALRRMDVGSAIVMPLRAAGQTLGAMSFWRGRAGAAFRNTDLLLAEEIATRAAMAIQQARLFETALTASKAKSDFLAVMSHELRTPLTTIVGYTDLILGGVPDQVPEQARAYIERVRVAAGHLLGLIEQILVYARLDTSPERPRPERIELARFLREAAQLMEPVAQEKGIGFGLDLPPSETVVESDPTRLRQILLNLLSNAVKFTGRGEIRLGATTDGESVTIQVSDTGIGIAAEHLDRVFEPFWQVDQSPTRRTGGAGLGLAVTHRIARYLGGSIRVSSVLGEGTTFELDLPARWRGEVEGEGGYGRMLVGAQARDAGSMRS
jgi:PAS domain S-box-containing protein